MKKSKLIVGLSAAFVGLIALASCSGSVTSAGDVLLYYNGQPYTAEDLFNEKVNTPDAAQAAFNAVYKVAVRNWANTQESGLKKEIENETKNKVSSAKADASSNASKNGTSYDVEFNKILSSNGVDSEAALYNKFEYDIQKTKFEDKFYERNYEVLKKGGQFLNKDGQGLGDSISGYLNTKHPYHMKHILVKLTTSSENYKREEISVKEAQTISKIVKALAKGNMSFGQIAYDNQSTGDSGSAAELGSVGIMDVDTSFVDEFKLGTYLFDAYFNSATLKDDSSGDHEYKTAIDSLLPENSIARTKFADEIINTLTDPSAGVSTIQSLPGIGTIPYEAAVKLGDWAEVEFTDDFVKETKAIKNNKYLPRNVLFNKYFNKHSISVITPNHLPYNDATKIYSDDSAAVATNYVIKKNAADKIVKIQAEKYRGNYNGDYDASSSELKGFATPVSSYRNNSTIARLAYDSVQQKYVASTIDIPNDDGTGTTTAKNSYLRDTDGRIVFVVRGKDGIHFIVAERSPFIVNETLPDAPTEATDKKMPLENYYTTSFPGEPNGNYPMYSTGTTKPTFVTYTAKKEITQYKKLSGDVKSKLKSYDPNLSKHIYNYLIKEGDLSFVGRGAQIQEVITNWINISIKSTDLENKEKWNKSWHDYYWKIKSQNERRKEYGNKETNPDYYNSELIPEVCAFAMANADINLKKTETSDKVGLDVLEPLFGEGGIFHDEK